MLVVDSKNSEVGSQRRICASSGRLIHCCCVCGKLGIWASGWSYYGSLKDADDGLPLRKFCSPACALIAGTDAQNVTHEMVLNAEAAEYREPRIVYRRATDQEKYRSAVSKQKRSK